MTPKNQGKRQAGSLRRRAEERVAKRGESAAPKASRDMKRLVHELEVHQVELELQNEELRQARIELEASYNELYDFAPVGYFTLGRHGSIEKTNLTGASMLGQPRAQLLGRRLAAFVLPESLPCFNDFLRRVTGGRNKESCMVTLMKHCDTPVFTYIEATGAGPDSDCRAVVVDITSAEQAKLALKESEERLRLALAATGTGVWEWERGTGDVYWSSECFKIFGIRSLSPKLRTLEKLLHPEDAPRIRSIVSQALADGGEQSAEYRIIRPNGEIAWIMARGQVQFDKAGKPLRLIGIAQDITERRNSRQNA